MEYHEIPIPESEHDLTSQTGVLISPRKCGGAQEAWMHKTRTAHLPRHQNSFKIWNGMSGYLIRKYFELFKDYKY